MFDEKDGKSNWIIGLICSNLLFIIGSIYIYFNPICSYETKPVITNTKIMVQIAGEVKKPNVYEIEAGMRLFTLIELSGGFTDEADTNSINLSLKLYDEMKITIPNKNCDTDESENNEQKININTADAKTLETLKGIGEVKAIDIIAHREKYGYFKTIEEIQRVTGIGEKTFENIKDYICI